MKLGFVSRVRKWLERGSKPPTTAKDLIWRSEGLAGDYRISLTIDLIHHYNLTLPWSEVRQLIKRYKQHVSFWDVRLEVMREDLLALSRAVKYPYEKIGKEFDALNVRK